MSAYYRSNSYPGSFLMGRKDPAGGRWSRDLLKLADLVLINYLGFLFDNHSKWKL